MGEMRAQVENRSNKGGRREVLVHGLHVYGNLYGCDSELLKDEVYLTKVVKYAAEVANATILATYSYKFGVTGGVSVIAIVAESHISIHTWPEHEYATVDVYTCGSKTKPLLAFDYIARSLNAKKVEVYISDRSYYTDETP